jgi:hypothetical protein
MQTAGEISGLEGAISLWRTERRCLTSAGPEARFARFRGDKRGHRKFASAMLRACLALLAALAAIEVACNDGSEEETRYNMKLGFIPGTKDDVATGHMTLDEGRRRCTAEPKCTAITYHGRPDASGQVFVYLKADTSVAEADKTWTSYIKVCPHASTAPEIIKRHTPLSSHAHAHRGL